MAFTSWRMLLNDEKHRGRGERADVIYVGTYYNYLFAINSDGTLKWKASVGTYNSTPVVAPDGTIYVGSHADNKIYAFNPDGTLKWTYATGNEISNTPAIAPDGMVYVCSQDYHLYAVDPGGNLKWKYYMKIVPPFGAPTIFGVGFLLHSFCYSQGWHDLCWKQGYLRLCI